MAQLYYTAFTVSAAQCGSADSTDFPVGIIDSTGLARLKTTGNGGHVANANGYDIRPYSDAGLTTALTYELVVYDQLTGKIEMWVKVPTLSHTVNTVIYLGYGDTTLVTDGSSTSTWDTNFKGVYHFGNGSTLTTTDSSTAGHNIVTNVGTAIAAAGPTCGGVQFNGSTQYLNYGNVADFNFGTGNFTISTWAKSSNTGVGVLTKDINAGASGIYLYAASGPTYNYYNSTSAYVIGAAGATFHNAAVVRTGTGASQLLTYYDGAPSATGTESRNLSNATAFAIGGFASGSQLLNGVMDEVRISVTARSASWMLAEYNNIFAPTTFYAVGTEQAVGSATVIRYNSLLNGTSSSGSFFRNPLG